MKLHIIHDNRRPERYVDLMLELSRQGILDYQIFDAIVMTHSVVASINASHKMVVRYAKNAGLKEVCIAEDDLWFPAKDGWQFFLKNKPQEFDIYFGGSYMVDKDGMIGVCGFHLYVVKADFYDTFLSVPDNVHIDSHFNDVEGDYKFCKPFPALQRPAYSANCNAFVSYNNQIPQELIYKGHV